MRQLKAIGFDSGELLQAHIEESPRAMHLAKLVLVAACMDEAVCAVCGQELLPLVIDNNHHAAFESELGDVVLHYCGQHCPACNVGNE